ncbi:hypothetical protein ACHABQ_02865 [Nesterenkonia aurantiaca]|uniref:hypothetical protein n=1 Tax=Nesterenkonia aurantiaca TaxID=1436010 RepID=UPI003EE7870A
MPTHAKLANLRGPRGKLQEGEQEMLEGSLVAAVQAAVDAGRAEEARASLEKMLLEGEGAIDDATLKAFMSTEGTESFELLRSTFSLRDSIDARLYGLTEGTQDASPALAAAADVARAQKRALFIPSGTYYLDAPLDLRYLSIDLEGSLIVRHSAGVGVIVGDTSSQRNSRRIHLREVVHEGYSTADLDRPHAALRVIGLKSAFVNVGRASIMELWANDTAAADSSIAYTNFNIGRVNSLKVLGAGGVMPWINENIFFGGSFARIEFDGPYPHNNNKFIKPAVEGPASFNPYISIKSGQGNIFEDMRAEGATRLKFTENAQLNVFLTLWQSNPDLFAAPLPVDGPIGNNIVVSRPESFTHRRTIARLDVNTQRSSTFCEVKGANPARLSLGWQGRYLTVSNQWSTLMDFEIPIEDDMSEAATDVRTLHPTSRMTRFLIRSDKVMLRPEIQGFTAGGNLILPSETPFLSTWNNVTAGTDRYTAATATSHFQLRVISPLVRYLRIYVRNGVADVSFKHVTVTGYLEVSQDPGILDQAIRAAHNRPVPA